MKLPLRRPHVALALAIPLVGLGAAAAYAIRYFGGAWPSRLAAGERLSVARRYFARLRSAAFAMS